MTGRARAEAALSEADWQRRVTDYARLAGWLVSHVRPSQHRGRWHTATEGDPGLPDLILSRRGVVLLAELKTDKGAFRPGQQDWINSAGTNGHVWRPRDWNTVQEVLK